MNSYGTHYFLIVSYSHRFLDDWRPWSLDAIHELGTERFERDPALLEHLEPLQREVGLLRESTRIHVSVRHVRGKLTPFNHEYLRI